MKLVSLFVASALSLATVAGGFDEEGYWNEPINAVLDVGIAPVATTTAIFNAMRSNHGYLERMTYRFDFTSDGAWDYEGPVGVAEHVYDEPGVYRVTLEVQDGFDRTASTTAKVEVAPVSALGPPLSPDDGATELEGFRADKKVAAPGDVVTLKGPKQDAAVAIRLVRHAEGPSKWFGEYVDLYTFSEPTTEYALLVPESTEPGTYDILVLTDDGAAAELQVLVQRPFPVLLTAMGVAGVGVVLALAWFFIGQRRRRGTVTTSESEVG